MIRCPVCGEPTGEYTEPGVEPGTTRNEDYRLYQFSYKGERDYLSPRCLACYEKVEARRKAKTDADNEKRTG